MEDDSEWVKVDELVRCARTFPLSFLSFPFSILVWNFIIDLAG